MCHSHKEPDPVSDRKSTKKVVFVYEFLTNIRYLFSFISKKRQFVKN
jgi:hypothetical protein